MGMDRSAENASPKNSLILLFYLALALLVPLIGIAYLSIETPEVKTDAYQNLQNIAHLKTERIESWLFERQGDALMLKDSENLMLRIEQFEKHPEQTGQKKILQNRLDSIRADHAYSSVMLLDAHGGFLLGSGDDTEITPVARSLYFHALASKQIVRGDLYHDSAGNVRMDWAVPLVALNNAASIGAILLRVDPRQYL